MADFLGSLVGHFVNFIVVISHAFNILFRNFVLLAFVVAILFGFFRLGQKGWRYLRGQGSRQDQSLSAPKDELKDGGA